MVVDLFKPLLRKLLPTSTFGVIRDRWHRRQAIAIRRKRTWALARFIELYGQVVLQGPFAGLKYLESASGSELLPKLVGCYESELHGVINDIICNRYTQIIDIGCAEGYYAVGLAYRCPWATVIAYDVDAEARKRCREMSKLNNVDSQVDIRELFSTKTYVPDIRLTTLIICDCEGAELELFGNSDAQLWQHCDLLIELHSAINHAITPAIIANFSSTHEVRLIDSVISNNQPIPSVWYLNSEKERKLALSEERFPMQWAWITKRVDRSRTD